MDDIENLVGIDFAEIFHIQSELIRQRTEEFNMAIILIGLLKSKLESADSKSLQSVVDQVISEINHWEENKWTTK
jgi:hypothetical protein